ncbi:MAG: dual specificity protein phosphatase family protein [Verrucomicrobia bacterium]|nr:dual specificity protein phosphatase family protein [Verrucomicrobiota bacterium]
MTKPDPNTYWVVPDKLLAGEYPGHLSAVAAREKLRAFLDAGVRHFVDLTQAGELEDYREILLAEAKALGAEVTYRRVPIQDFSVPEGPDAMASILDAIDAGWAREGVTYVHCWGGIGRTGLVIACWLQKQGRTADEALAELAQLWQASDQSKRYPNSPETAAQVAWVRNWRGKTTTTTAAGGG